MFGPKHSFEQCHCSAGPGLMRKARSGDRPPDRFHRHVVAHSNNERRLQDRTEVAAQLQIEEVPPSPVYEDVSQVEFSPTPPSSMSPTNLTLVTKSVSRAPRRSRQRFC